MLNYFKLLALILVSLGVIFLWRFWWVVIIPIGFIFIQKPNPSIKKYSFITITSWLIYCSPYLIRLGKIRIGEGFLAFPLLTLFEYVLSSIGAGVFVFSFIMLVRSISKKKK